jgi:predicted AlkP superfamily phosphohydrolase/phosphomutase
MSQPVKLSDALVLDARIAGEAEERSIAGQVEFWAKLGRAMELLLNGQQVSRLQRSVGTRSLAEALASVETPEGRKRVADVLARQPYPHYKQYAGQPGLLVRIDEDGTETVGRFENRTFVAAVPIPATRKTAFHSAKTSSRLKAVATRIPAKPASPAKGRKAWA